MKVMRLVFSCVFLVTASTALPYFFGLDATTAELSSGSNSDDSYSDWISRNRFGNEISRIDQPYITPLPVGGSAIIWINGKYKE